MRRYGSLININPSGKHYVIIYLQQTITSLFKFLSSIVKEGKIKDDQHVLLWFTNLNIVKL